MSSCNINNHEYLTCEEIVPFNQKINNRASYIYLFSFGKSFWKTNKTIEDQGKEQFKVLKSLESSNKQLPSIKYFISKERLNLEIICEIERIEKEGKKADRSKIVCKGYNKNYDFGKFKTIRAFSNDFNKNSVTNMSIANDEKNHLAKHIKEFKSKTWPQDPNLKGVKEDVINSAMALLKEREMVKAFENGLFLKSEKLEQSDQSEEWNSVDKCLSLKLDNDLNTSGNIF